MKCLRYTETPYIENEDTALSHTENSKQINNNKINNNKIINTVLNNYQSINNTELQKKEIQNQTTEQNNFGIDWIDRYNKTTSAIKNQIGYDDLTLTNNAEIINDIVSVMAEIMLVDTPYYTIEGKQIPTELVRINYSKITYGRLDTFLLDFSYLYYKIKNPKKYLITALYNIASTAETSITNRVNYDMYGGQYAKK